MLRKDWAWSGCSH